MARHNFYRDIHKAIRFMMSDLLRKAGRVDYTDTCAISLFRAEMKTTFDMLSAHAHHENTFIGPLLLECAPELADLIGGTHDDQERTLESLLARLDAIDSRSADAAAKGHALVVALSRMTGEFFVHMADEEEQIMPALWRGFDDGKLLAVHQAIIASIPPGEMAQEMTWMLPAMNTPDRIQMLAGIRATAPAEVFGFLCELARGVLDARDEAELEAGLATTEAKVA